MTADGATRRRRIWLSQVVGLAEQSRVEVAFRSKLGHGAAFGLSEAELSLSRAVGWNS